MSILEFSNDIDTAEAPAPLPIGTYPASVTKAEVRTSQSSGNQYLAITFHVSADDYPADFADGDPDGETLSYNRILYDDSNKGRYRMKKFLDALGHTVKSRLDVNDLVGLTANVLIGHTEYEGEMRAEIQRVQSV